MSKETILVVEDETLVGMELKEDLERLGYNVPEVIENGESVVQAVAKYQPDLMLMDIRLAGSVDGIEAAYQAKAEFDIPIIYLTAYSDPDTLRRAAITTPEAYLLKPFEERELAANVAIALAKSRSGDSVRREIRHAIPLVDVLDEPAVLADVEDRIVHVNRAAAILLRARDPSFIRGMELSKFLEPRSGDSGGKYWRLREPDAGKASFQAHSEPLSRSDGRVFGSLVVFESMDKRERALLESTANAANESLARLLPSPDAAGSAYRVGGFLLPCQSGSGDLFGVFSAEPGTVAFFGLDVMGHGILASLAARSLRGSIVRLATVIEDGTVPSPVEVVKELDRSVRSNAENWGGAFVTLAFGLLDEATGDYRIARAGHAPALHVDAGGGIRSLYTPGTALGLAAEAPLEEGRGRLEPGDRLLVLSDGILGRFGPGNLQAAIDSFGGFVAQGRGLSLEELVESIRERALVDQASAQAEDFSLLAIERKA